MLSNAQSEIIDTYVSADLFDREKLKKYLNTHDMVGNEVFAYCDLGKGNREDRGYHSYSHYLDDEYGFNPVSTATFVRRIPFYFYVSNYEDIRIFGNLGCVVHSIYDRQMNENAEALEQAYVELEYMFYEKQFPPLADKEIPEAMHWEIEANSPFVKHVYTYRKGTDNAYEDEDGKHYKVVTYSRPFADEMFILFVESHECGLIDDVQVIFYESIDRMFIELGRSLASMKRKKLEILEEHELEEVAKDFIW